MLRNRGDWRFYETVGKLKLDVVLPKILNF
jgi:hypothetical protein